MKLISISKNGTLKNPHPLTLLAENACRMNVDNYKREGFQEPWIAYIAFVDNKPVGTCAFKSPPKQGRCEIAYYTFPEYERKGYATAMARELIQIATHTDPTIEVYAQTLPENNPSTKILAKLGFTKLGVVTHPEDGQVWEWAIRKCDVL